MNVKQKNPKKEEIMLPEKIYASYLKIINGVSFTQREIDVISCLVSAKRTERTASFLSISPRTVQNHIRNITSKLGCKSQDGIIEFIEQSDRLFHVREYYGSLFTQSKFELQLKKISILEIQRRLSCIIVYEHDQTEKISLIEQLERHLRLAGIKVSIQVRPRYQSINSLVDKIEAQETDYIIYSLPSIFIEKQKTSDELTDLDENGLIEINSKYLNSLLILLLDREPSILTPKELIRFNCIDLATQKNYYFLVFEILKKILPIKIDKNVSGFQFQNENFNISPSLPPSDFLLANTENIIRWNLPRQDHLFIGRRELLDELEKKLHSGDQIEANAPITIVVCVGLDGVGKSQIALQYTHSSKHTYTLRAWFTAENLDELKQQYIEFAKKLGYTEKEPSIKTALPYVKEWLLKNPGWLLVYDNASTYEGIKEFFPENGGSIILTSRQQTWPSRFEILDIDTMSKEESVGLIQSLIRRDIIGIEQEAIKILVDMLGYLPLALAQAGAYIYQNQITIAKYNELYKNYEQRLLSNNAFPEGINCLPIAINWDINLDAIVKEAKLKNKPPFALELLSLCAYLAPERIPYSLLLTWIKKKYTDLADAELELLGATSQLRQYSLIKIETDGDIAVHRLVQTVVRQQHKQTLCKEKSDCPALTLEWYIALIESAHAVFSPNKSGLKNNVQQGNMLPHLQILLSHYKQLWPDESEFNITPIFNDIGAAFLLIGEIKNASSYYERALSALEQNYGKSHPQLTYTLDQLGRTYRYLRNTTQAKDCHERALKIKEQYYDENHVELISTLDELGRDYRDLGDALQAKNCHEHVLRIKEQYDNGDYFELAYTLDQLGIACRDLGSLQDAKQFHERALIIKELYLCKILFSKDECFDEHIWGRLTPYSSFTSVYGSIRYSGLFKRVQDTWNTSWYINDKFYESTSLNDKNKSYIIMLLEIAFTLDQLGMDYRDLEDVLKEKNCHERSLEIKERCYHNSHISIVFSLEQLANSYKNLGDIENAKKFHERALQIKQEGCV